MGPRLQEDVNILVFFKNGANLEATSTSVSENCLKICQGDRFVSFYLVYYLNIYYLCISTFRLGF
jgi:hypothetical protein